MKINDIMPFVTTWMDLEIILLSEDQTEKDKYLWYCLRVKSKKMIQMNLCTKQKQIYGLKKKFMVTKEKGKGKG